jgi:hypothetical protein
MAVQVGEFCGYCHAVPPPDSFPRKLWKEEVSRGFAFATGKIVPKVTIEDVARFYQDRAPETLPLARPVLAGRPLPVRFTRLEYPPPRKKAPAISNVNLVHLFDARRLDVLACEMRDGEVMVLSPYEKKPKWRILARVSNPAHAEVVDLDGDGIKDVLVANLGNFMPTDSLCGSVVWLRGKGDGTFQTFTLLDNVGRVADVQAADFRGTGKKDIIVAAFGWQKTGEIIFLENQTEDWSHPRFKPRVVDKRHGAIHVPVTDLNNDGKPDFVALISQEHETVVAFLNRGDGQFTTKTIWTAPHPAYGSSGIQLVDLDGDGDLDVLYANGDTLDHSSFLKPYHGIHWLENRGNFPFTHHLLAPMCGVHRAVAGDLANRGKKDVVAVSFLPMESFPQRNDLNLESVLVLEASGAGTFSGHALETITCDRVSVAVGDVFGTGRQDIVAGNFSFFRSPLESAITIWKNLGP